jgi:SAM-dependent methyltransferase
MKTSEPDFQGNIERFSGFADIYDKYRPAPPTELGAVLTRLAQVNRPRLVVDLGSGTGLSTRYWVEKAEQVVGIEPSDDMRRQALAQTQAQNVAYQEGFSHATGLPEQCADIVTCAQSLHWMEPEGTFREVVRILRSGGVFAAFDYDWPPYTGAWQADAAYEVCIRKVEELAKDIPDSNRVRRWEKSRHLQRMRTSGRFRYARELVLHHVDQGNAERLVGLLLSQGSVMTLLKNGISEEQCGINVFRRTAQQFLGEPLRAWYWSSRVRLGVV